MDGGHPLCRAFLVMNISRTAKGFLHLGSSECGVVASSGDGLATLPRLATTASATGMLNLNQHAPGHARQPAYGCY
jgi:hypothetical protein